MPLCARCEQRSDPRGHSYTFGALKDTACEFCRVVYEGVIAALAPICPDDGANVTFPPFSGRDIGHFEVSVFTHNVTMSFWCSWGTTCPWGLLPTRRDITPVDYDGDGSFQTALEWIENCIAHHQCSDIASLPALPTRVVETGVSGGMIRVVNGASRKGRYVCLSHCWGQERPLMTTAQTLQSRMNEITWNSIPATFQDAITVTRRLGVQFIWIDSLCIIQDSVEDWGKESSRMAEIYRNSYVTIAGASSKDSKGGLGINRASRSETTLQGTTRAGKPYSIRVQHAITPHMQIDEKTPKDGILHPIPSITSLDVDRAEVFEAFPLLTRGWVFQERLLSPRFLQFGKDELLWDCRESMTCECGQRPPDLPYNQVAMMHEDGYLAYKWRKIVEFYCSLDLTYLEDKLPALSGLAKQLAEQKPGMKYLGGLWSESLDLDLIWIPYGPVKRRAQMDIAPSWSWAHVDRRIIYPSVWRAKEEQPSVKVLDSYFKLIEAECNLSGTDVTGRVSGGVLVLKAPLCSISVHKPQGEGQLTEFRYGDTSFFLGTDGNPRSLRSNWRLPFVDQRRRAFLDHPGMYDRLMNRNNIYGCRLTRVEILEDSIFFFSAEAREVIHVEFSMLLERVDETFDMFKRIGLLADGRFIEGYQADVDSWVREPSCFEAIDGSVIRIK